MAVYHEYIIIGAGPGGLQMGYYMEKNKADYLILEGANKPGNFFTTQPRHRTLISINKVYNPFPEKEFNMRHDWNSLLCDDDSLRFTKYTEELFPHADVLVRYLNDFAHKNELKIIYQTYVDNINKFKCPKSGEDRFKLKTKEGKEYECRVLLMATGVRKEMLPDIPGIEHADTYTEHSIDQNDYKGKTVGVIGRGNSAFEVANHIAGHAAVVHIFGQIPPKFAWDTHFVGDLRAVNNNILDMYQLKSLHSYILFDVLGLKKLENGKIEVEVQVPCLHAEPPGFYRSAYSLDKVISCTGFKYIDRDIFSDNCKPNTRKNGKFPVLKNNWETENVPNMYYIGTPMQTRDRKAASGFIHGFRYNVRTLYHLLREKYDDIPYARTELERDASFLGKRIIDRMSIADGLYQMQGFLCDVLIVPEETDKKAAYYEELPLDYVLDNEYFTNQQHMFITVLKFTFDRFGKFGKTATNWGQMPNYLKPECQAFLRPIISYYNKGKYVGEQAANESLLLRFDVKGFRGTNGDINPNRFANFINVHTNISPGAKYNLDFYIDEDDYKQFFVPLTEEQKKRLPPEYYEATGCKPANMFLLKEQGASED